MEVLDESVAEQSFEPGVSIVIPVRNEGRIIRACLESCIDQETMPHEIIVVDNDSTDSTLGEVAEFEWANQFPVNVVRSPAGNRYGGLMSGGSITRSRNLGFDEAEAEIIGRIDADTLLHPHWVQSVQEVFAENPEVVGMHGVTGLREFSPSGKFWATFHMAARQRFCDKRAQQIHLMGHNMAVRTDSWHKAKQFLANRAALHDELPEFGDILMLEDLDLSLALTKTGGELIHNPEMIAKIIGHRSVQPANVLFSLAPFSKQRSYTFQAKHTIERHAAM